MKKFSKEIGILHFVGIGGIGMSAIAEVMHTIGYKIRGSDLSSSLNVDRLRSLGVEVFIGHSAENIKDASVIVISSAVKEDNVELESARISRIPVVSRAEMLAELMRLKSSIAVGGTHGKTTTTSMISSILDEAKMDPTVINGGIINSYGSNARLGKGDWMVVEADESDGTFINLPSLVTVVTNIDYEHIDYYGSFESLKLSFKKFIQNIPFYGFSVISADHTETQSLNSEISDRKIITYGLNPQADIRGTNIRTKSDKVIFNIEIFNQTNISPKIIENISLSMPGNHNVQNALAATAVALELGIDLFLIKNALNKFKGVKRRFSILAKINNITVVDDYGHHPEEIKSVLSAARSFADGNVIAVVQPHRYSRLQSLFEEFTSAFNDADILFVSDVYSAGEKEISGVTGEHLVKSLKVSGHRNVSFLKEPEKFFQTISDILNPGDVLIYLGAGDITKWAQSMAIQLREKFK